MQFVKGDCMDYLPGFDDGFFDLAIVDPPYGGGSILMQQSSGTSTEGSGNGSTATSIRQGGRAWSNSYTLRGGAGSTLTPNAKVGRTGGTWATKYQTNGGIFDHDIRHWDIAPDKDYFDQLFRVSKNQIIWGGNYFELPPTRCFVVWRKTNIPLRGFTMAPCEYAWTSFNRNAVMFEYTSSGHPGAGRIHPTQKPVALYEWLLDQFAEPGMRVLDTHVGSGSSAIACKQCGYDFIGFEINDTYYAMASERIEMETRQETIFGLLGVE